MQSTEKYDAVIAAINFNLIYHEVTKPCHDASEQLNFSAMIVSQLIHQMERVPMTNDLVKKSRNDVAFELGCNPLISDSAPSEASYLRLVDKLDASNTLKQTQEQVIEQTLKKDFITVDAIVVGITHFEERAQTLSKQKKEKPTSKEIGRKSKPN